MTALGRLGAASMPSGSHGTGFNRLGAASADVRANSSGEEEHGEAGVCSINSGMSGKDVFNALETAGVPRDSKAELTGLLLCKVAPEVVSVEDKVLC